jgi:hypothetical protein
VGAQVRTAGRLAIGGGGAATLSGQDTTGNNGIQNWATFFQAQAGSNGPQNNTYVIHAFRVYFRIRALPTGSADLQFYHCANGVGAGGTAEGSPAIHMAITPTGQISAYNQGNAGSPTLIGTTANSFFDSKWHRLNVAIAYRTTTNPTPTNAEIAWIVDDPFWQYGLGSYLYNRFAQTPHPYLAIGALPAVAGNAVNVFMPGGVDVGINYTGRQGANADRWLKDNIAIAGMTGGVLDIDDYVADSEVIPGPGFITTLRPVSLGTYQQFVTQDYRSLLQRPLSGSATNSDNCRTNVISSGPRLSAVMENGVQAGIGTIKSACVAVYGGITRGNWQTFVIRNGVRTDSPVMTGTSPSAGFKNPDPTGNKNPGSSFFLGTGDTANWKATDTFEVGVKDGDTAGAGTTFINGLYLIVEHERADPPATIAPTGDVEIATGSYVGNGTVLDVDLPFKPQFLMLKPDNRQGCVWHEKIEPLGSFAQTCSGTNYSSNGLVRVADRPGGGGYMTVVLPGSDNAHVNEAGITVRWLAIRDPKRRMMVLGADSPNSQSTSGTFGDNQNVFFPDDPTFNPEMLFAFGLFFSSATQKKNCMRSSLTHVGDSSTPIGGSDAAEADGIQSMGAGTFQAGSKLLTFNCTSLHYFGFRSLNVFNQKRLCFIGSYTGDGTNPRTINFQFPLYNAGMVLIMPQTGVDKMYRFAGETTAHVYSGGTNRANTITAFDQNGFTVATTGTPNMNQAGVVYDYIAFAGGFVSGPSVCFGGPFSTSDPDESTFPLASITAPLTWVEFLDVKNTLEVWSKIALPDPSTYFGGFKDHIVQNWGTITRGLSDRRGQYEGAEWNFTVADTDGRVRNKLGNFSTQYFTGRGITARMIDDTSRRLQLSPRTVVKGFINRYRPLGNRLFEFNIGDTLSVKFNSQNSNDQLPQRLITKADFPNALDQPDSANTGVPVTVGEPVPIIYGKITDRNNVVGGVDDGDGQYPGVYVGKYTLPDANLYHKWVLAGHAVTQIDGVYIDNGDTAGGGTNPASSNIGDLTVTAGAGGDWVIPGYNNWPTLFGTGAPLYEDINGNRYTVVYGKVGATGPDKGAGVAAAANDKSVPLAFSVAGIEDKGDGTGCLIVDAFQQYKHFMINWVFNNYKAGAWFSAPFFPDDSSLQMVDTESFDQASLDAQDRLPGVGYQGDWSLGAGGLGMGGQYQKGERISVREAIARLNLSFDVDCGFNRRMQFFIVMEKENLTAANSGEVLTDVRHIIADSFDIEDAFDEHFNKYLYRHTKDFFGRDARGWRFESTQQDDESIANYDPINGQSKDSPETELFCVRGKNRTSDSDWYTPGTNTAEDVIRHRLRRSKYVPRYATFKTGMFGMNYELGDVVLVTHFDGVGANGWVMQPLRIVNLNVDPEEMTVEIRGYDMGNLFDLFILGDDTILPSSWTSATTAQKFYGFLGDEITGLFSNGEPMKRLG